MRVAFAGTPDFALPALEALLGRHQVVGVLTQPDRPRGRGRGVTAGPVKALAQARGVPVLQPQTLRSEAARAAIAAWDPEALIVVAYGALLPREVLLIPRLGCLNIHASLLPRWRGAAPVQRAILAGDAVTGVSIMLMDEGLDTGPVLLQEQFPLGARVTGGSLGNALAALGAAAMVRALDGLAAGTLQPRPQPRSGATYARKIQKIEARIDWSRPATEIERQIRALNPRPVAETLLDGEQLRIYDAEVLNELESAAKVVDPGSIIAISDQTVLVQCGTGTLVVTEVQKAGGRPMRAGAFARGVALAGRHFG